MRVDMNISSEIKEPYAVIHAGELTPEIAELAREISQFQNGKSVIIGKLEDSMVVIEPEQIVLIRVENEKVYIVAGNTTYRVGKRMYELLEILGLFATRKIFVLFLFAQAVDGAVGLVLQRNHVLLPVGTVVLYRHQAL